MQLNDYAKRGIVISIATLIVLCMSIVLTQWWMHVEHNKKTLATTQNLNNTIVFARTFSSTTEERAVQFINFFIRQFTRIDPRTIVKAEQHIENEIVLQKSGSLLVYKVLTQTPLGLQQLYENGVQKELRGIKSKKTMLEDTFFKEEIGLNHEGIWASLEPLHEHSTKNEILTILQSILHPWYALSMKWVDDAHLSVALQNKSKNEGVHHDLSHVIQLPEGYVTLLRFSHQSPLHFGAQFIQQLQKYNEDLAQGLEGIFLGILEEQSMLFLHDYAKNVLARPIEFVLSRNQEKKISFTLIGSTETPKHLEEFIQKYQAEYRGGIQRKIPLPDKNVRIDIIANTNQEHVKKIREWKMQNIGSLWLARQSNNYIISNDRETIEKTINRETGKRVAQNEIRLDWLINEASFIPSNIRGELRDILKEFFDKIPSELLWNIQELHDKVVLEVQV